MHWLVEKGFDLVQTEEGKGGSRCFHRKEGSHRERSSHTANQNPRAQPEPRYLWSAGKQKNEEQALLASTEALFDARVSRYASASSQAILILSRVHYFTSSIPRVSRFSPNGEKHENAEEEVGAALLRVPVAMITICTICGLLGKDFVDSLTLLFSHLHSCDETIATTN